MTVIKHDNWKFPKIYMVDFSLPLLMTRGYNHDVFIHHIWVEYNDHCNLTKMMLKWPYCNSV
jgi:hypothetical protein